MDAAIVPVYEDVQFQRLTLLDQSATDTKMR